MITTTCKSCGNTRSFQDTYSGRKFKCPSCGKPVTIGTIDTVNSKTDTENTNVEKPINPVEKKPLTEDTGNSKTGATGNGEEDAKSIGDVRSSTADIPLSLANAEVNAPEANNNEESGAEKDNGDIAGDSLNEGIIISGTDDNIINAGEDRESIATGNSLADTDTVTDLMNSGEAMEDTKADSLVESAGDTGFINDVPENITENDKSPVLVIAAETKINAKEPEPNSKDEEHSRSVPPVSQKVFNSNLGKNKVLIFIGLFLVIGITAFLLFFKKSSKVPVGNTVVSEKVNLNVSEKDSYPGKNIISLKTEPVNIGNDQLPENNGKIVETEKTKKHPDIDDERNSVNGGAGTDKFNYLTLIQIKNDLLNRPLCEGLTYTGLDQKLTVTGNVPDKEYQKKLDLYGGVTIRINFKDLSENKSCIVEIFYKKREHKFDLITHAEK